MLGLFVKRTGTLSLINDSKRPKIQHDPENIVIEEFIGRPSVLGNPHVLRTESDRDRVCDLYDEWLQAQIDNRNEAVVDKLNQIAHWLKKGHDVRLICFCKPKRCHGDSVVKQVNKLMGK